MRNLMYSLLVSVFCIGLASAQEDGDRLIGVWQPSAGNAYVKIEKIGNKYYGRIVWLKEPDDEEGKPKTDVNNPDESLRSTPLKGYRMLKDFVWDVEEKIWKDGTIYDPKNGTTYSCKIELTEENKIEVRGFVGTAVFGRTDVWTRLVKKK